MTTIGLYRVKRPTKSRPKRKVWQMRWHDSTGKFCCETIEDSEDMPKRDAARIRRDKQSKVDCKIIPVDRPERVTLAEYAKRDREAIRADVRCRTLIEYQVAADHAIAALGGTIHLNRIGRPEVIRIKNRLVEKGRSPATVRKVVRSLSAMMRRAEADGLIHRNPFAGEARGKTQEKRARFYTAEEIEAMHHGAPDDWWRLMIRLAVTTGLRKTELLNLLWSDIDFAGSAVTISRKDAGRFTVGEAGYPVLPWVAKDHEQRTIPVSADVLDMLRRFREESDGSLYVFLPLTLLRKVDARIKAGTWTATSQLFPSFNRHFNAIQRQARAWLALRRDVNRAEVHWPLGSPHDLRKTYANTMKRHVSPDVLKGLMGHSDIGTTMQYYAGTTTEDSARVRAALAAEFGGEICAQVARKPESGDSQAGEVAKNRVPATVTA